MAERAGPIMKRHIIDGSEVFLPADAKLFPRLRSDLPLCPMCLGAGGNEAGQPIWICGECGGTGQVGN